MITSTSNAQVKQLLLLQKKAKERNARDVFVVEGPKMYRETPRERLVQTYVSEGFYKKNQRLFDGGGQVTVLSDRVFESVSDTRTPQGVLCVVRQYHYKLADLLGSWTAAPSAAADTLTTAVPFAAADMLAINAPSAAADTPAANVPSADNLTAGTFQTGEKAGQRISRKPLLLALENLQDPGNLGTILRTSEGAGVTGVLLGTGCVDLYNPKVIRSTMGAIYRVPFYYTEDFRRDLRALQREGVRWYAAHLEGSVPYDEEDYHGSCGFLIGNESQGLTGETTAAADARIRIPMCGQVESLNAAVAASVLMYEANRQRRNFAE